LFHPFVKVLIPSFVLFRIAAYCTTGGALSARVWMANLPSTEQGLKPGKFVFAKAATKTKPPPGVMPGGGFL